MKGTVRVRVITRDQGSPQRPAVFDPVDGQRVEAGLRVEKFHPQRLVYRLDPALLVVSVGVRVVLRAHALAEIFARAGQDVQVILGERVRGRHRRRRGPRRRRR